MKNKIEKPYVNIAEYSDIQLYNMISGEESDAHFGLEELYKKHSPRIYAYCRKILGDVPATDDVFQDTFVRFYKMGLTGQEVQNVAGYLLKIARNLCLNEKHRRINTMKVNIDDVDLYSSDKPYEQTELSRLIHSAIESLPEDYREALVLREMYGHSYDEIAKIVNANMPIVRTRIYRAKQKIRTMLEPFIQDLNAM